MQTKTRRKLDKQHIHVEASQSLLDIAYHNHSSSDHTSASTVSHPSLPISALTSPSLILPYQLLMITNIHFNQLARVSYDQIQHKQMTIESFGTQVLHRSYCDPPHFNSDRFSVRLERDEILSSVYSHLQPII